MALLAVLKRALEENPNEWVRILENAGRGDAQSTASAINNEAQYTVQGRRFEARHALDPKLSDVERKVELAKPKTGPKQSYKYCVWVRVLSPEHGTRVVMPAAHVPGSRDQILAWIATEIANAVDQLPQHMKAVGPLIVEVRTSHALHDDHQDSHVVVKTPTGERRFSVIVREVQP
jgi:hypothetical protein